MPRDKMRPSEIADPILEPPGQPARARPLRSGASDGRRRARLRIDADRVDATDAEPPVTVALAEAILAVDAVVDSF
jgi:hypothetical protein